MGIKHKILHGKNLNNENIDAETLDYESINSENTDGEKMGFESVNSEKDSCDAIICTGLTRVFGRLTALDNLSFNITPNTITGLIGRNGAGKTTLLKLISGLLKPTSGDISVLGMDPYNNLAISSNLVFIDDNITFPKTLTLGQILSHASSFYSKFDATLAASLCEYFDISTTQHHFKLSKGQKATFNSILGIAARCPVTIFDEPTTGMDSAARKDFYRALLKDYLAHPRTIILSSHLLGEVEEILEDILLINKGRLVFHMPILDVKEYAIALRGNARIIEELTANIDIIHKENFPPNNTYQIIKNQLSPQTLQLLKNNNIECSSVSADDVCVNLTTKNKGGIDDVFRRG